ncbi:MAG: succinate dehydrogenase assembly factor 2 [Alphaproteobacteria bacterium]
MTEDDSRIKRALYRAHHRGTKEMDLLLGRFADAELRTLNETDITAFDELLVMPDQPIQSWLAGEESPPPDKQGIIQSIRQFHGIKG